MRLKIATVITVGVAAVAITAPIALSIYLARSQGAEAESRRALGYAHEVLSRSEATVDQMNESFNKLYALGSTDPCSESRMKIMAELDLASSYILALGYVIDDKLICSSIGRAVGILPLGKVDYISREGIQGRINVTFPFNSDQNFAVFEKNGYAAIINKDLPIDVMLWGEDISLAVFSPVGPRFLTQKGFLHETWPSMLGRGYEVTFFDSGYAVAVVNSQQYELGAIAALPMSSVNRKVAELSLFLVPLGIIGGILFGVAFLFFARVQQAMPTMIKNALKHKEFFLEYQPIIDLQNGRWVGAEALLRWRRPSGEMIRPDIFIQAAEDSGLIRRVTKYVFNRIAEEAHELFLHFPDFHIGINLAAMDLKTSETIVELRHLIQQLQARPSSLMMEITERGFLDEDRGREILNDIRNEGVSIAIDDFGTGYSSLAYLETYDLDFLKIDKSFVSTIGSEAATSQVVPHIIEIAKTLNLQMIAEGVETETQVKFLLDHGVQYAQGWLFSRPMSFANIMERLKDGA